jgi:hypothetical protein
MTSKFFASLTVFSLAFLSAEEPLFEEIVVEDSTLASEEKQEEEKPKKLKPQYAGARRTQNNAKKKEPKNKWFSSKTHPKDKKETAQTTKEVPAELPADRPHYTKLSNPIKNSRSMPIELATESPPIRQTRTEPQVCYYPPAGFQAPRGHVYVTGEWLYWRTRQEGMEFATARSVAFDFQSGFRVGLGVHMPYDFWDVYVNYTRFVPDGSKSAHGSFYPLFLFQGAGIQGPAVAEADAHWKIQFQNADVEIGRAFYLAKTLVFRPFFGLKGAWIDQHARIHYEGGFIPTGQTFSTHFKNDFKGAGPLIGIESNWLIGAGFSLLGNLATSLVIGHFDMTQEQYQLDTAKVVDLNSDFNLVSPTFQVVAGFAWDRNFHRDQCHFGLSAGFEAQYWWAQNQTEQFTDKDFPTYLRQNGDLAFYGLTLRARIDF